MDMQQQSGVLEQKIGRSFIPLLGNTYLINAEYSLIRLFSVKYFPSLAAEVQKINVTRKKDSALLILSPTKPLAFFLGTSRSERVKGTLKPNAFPWTLF